jgi:exonuclease III
MSFTLSGDTSTVAVLLVYRPGSQKVTNEFFNELTQYLEAMSIYKCQLVIAGDLNINVADSNCNNASRLIDLFTGFDCVQRVTGETQVRGGTLDHVVTRSSDAISDLYVGPSGAISDHSLITWT